MLDTTSLVGNVSFILVFFAGITSFFSPCVIPLLPVYLGYLSGSDTMGEYKTKKILINTIAFVLGISVTFFLLGLAFTNVSQFFSTNKNIITKVSGIIVILFGLVQMDFIEFKFLNREKRINANFSKKTVNPLMAFLMGLTFSFAWTPCVGPMLSSVLLLASSAQSMFLGNVLVIVYTLGFIIPFILAGIFTTKLLNIFNKHKNIVKYVKKIGGLILIIMGIMMFTGWLNTVSGYLNSLTVQDVPQPTPAIEENITSQAQPTSTPQTEVQKEVAEDSSDQEQPDDNQLPQIVDFTLLDQHGNSHTL
jgi:cytochrome c-type biogenesis protein